MIKALVLLLVLTLPTLQSESVIVTSGDESATVATVGVGNLNDLPPIPPQASQPQPQSQRARAGPIDPNDSPDFSTAPEYARKYNQGQSPYQAPTSSPQDWSFIQGSSAANTNAKWKTPSSTYQTYPKGYRTTYTITFQTSCPQNPMHLVFATTGFNFVYLNG